MNTKNIGRAALKATEKGPILLKVRGCKLSYILLLDHFMKKYARSSLYPVAMYTPLLYTEKKTQGILFCAHKLLTKPFSLVLSLSPFSFGTPFQWGISTHDRMTLL